MEELSHQTYPTGALYVVATPIGNIGDITLRALYVLGLVECIACEDTRNTAHLLNRYGISKPLIAAHQHNELQVAETLIAQLRSGQRIALVSDAGTPAISDPGARIVDAVHQAGCRVIPVPGCSAATTALSASGLVNSSFCFVGFLPTKSQQRETVLMSLRALTSTLILYEAPHRILETVQALAFLFEPTRHIIFGRELTKLFEEIHRCTLAEAVAWITEHAHRQKGEFVLLIEGASSSIDPQLQEIERILRILLTECSLKQAVSLATQITGHKKNKLYQRALELTHIPTP